MLKYCLTFLKIQQYLHFATDTVRNANDRQFRSRKESLKCPFKQIEKAFEVKIRTA